MTSFNPLRAARQIVQPHRGRIAALLLAGILIGYVLEQLPTMPPTADYASVTIFWLLAFGYYLLAVAPPNSRSRLNWRAWWQTHWRAVLTLSTLVAAAFVLRVWQIGTIPFVLGGDEASFGLEALRVVNGTIRNPFSTGFLSQPTMSFFFNSVTLGILGSNQTALRLPWALVGTITIPVTYWLVARLKGVHVGFVAAALVATYHYHIHYSRLAVNNIADSLLTGLALLFLSRAIARASRWDWIFVGTACGAALYFYPGARLAPLLVIVVLGYRMVYARERSWREVGVGALAALGAFLIVGAPMLQYAYRFPDDFNARVNQMGILQSGWLMQMAQTRGSVAAVLFDQFRRAALAFNFYPDRTVWYGLPQPLLDPIFGTLFLIGLAYATVRTFLPPADRRLFPMVAWWWCATLLGGMLTENPPSSQRLITLAVPVCFFIALALLQIVRMAKRAFVVVPSRAILLAAVLLFGAISLQTYFADYIPKCIYGGSHAQAATMMAPILNELKTTHKIYFVGAPFMYWGYATLPFLVPDADAVDLDQPITAPLARELLPTPRGAVFIVVAERIEELARVRQSFPAGELRDIRTPTDKRLLAMLYIISPQGQ